ncbi:sugar ABC transporter permease [Paenibacillus psychroresistens]|uniref:Sugar ABC transporter permease n=1 Tax=Paenibacillus psychroresistens TaxID=1778678 RepID=A0A6B8RQV2_9BACL|nr:sugar ABC transporter permease [Paenibacillus psychroresistens]QGQ98092.1 sugar ABC transporter permease [Paenibacillus psychroresistens]
MEMIDVKSVQAVVKKKRAFGLAKQEKKAAFWFILPFVTGFLGFNLFPIVYAFLISLMDYRSFKDLGTYQFTGFKNYLDIMTDINSINAYLTSLYYILMYVPGIMIVSLLFALLLNRTFYLRFLTRSMVLMPYVSNIVAIAMVWSILLDPTDGPINKLLIWSGLKPSMWLMGTESALATVVLINIWQGLAFHAIVYLAALQAVPQDLYEAAEIDGASRFQKLRRITLPLVSPTSFFLVIISIITSLQNYASIKSMTNGGPGISTKVISFNIYEEAFTYNRFSYASAQAIILFLIILIVTIIQWKGQKRWVHY